MPLHNLLTEKLISVRYENGVKEKLALPGVLCKLSKEDIKSFAAHQPHMGVYRDCRLHDQAAG
jgi:hypothetical protein